MDYAAYEADRKKLAARIVAVRQIIQDTTILRSARDILVRAGEHNSPY